MFKPRMHVFTFLVLNLSSAFISAYPQKIVIKNATDEAITYMLDVRYKQGGCYRGAFMWLEPGEEQDIGEKYFLQLDKMPNEICYLNVAVNMKEPRDMQPFSEVDAHKVKFGNNKAVRIVVRKDRVGGLYHKVYPIPMAYKAAKGIPVRSSSGYLWK
jgi:hypothetical protein